MACLALRSLCAISNAANLNFSLFSLAVSFLFMLSTSLMSSSVDDINFALNFLSPRLNCFDCFVPGVALLGPDLLLCCCLVPLVCVDFVLCFYYSDHFLNYLFPYSP